MGSRKIGKDRALKMIKAMKPINGNTIKSIERNSAKFVYVNREKEATCERCGNVWHSEVKHLGKIVCPKCHLKATAIHSHRRSNNESLHWEATATALSGTIFVIRYYLVVRVNGKVVESGERARLFLDFEHFTQFKFEMTPWKNEWKVGGYNYFREYGMSYCQNKWFCLGADVRESFFREAQNLDCFKYFDIKAAFNNYWATSICYIAKHIGLFEKLQKAGLSQLIDSEMRNYSYSIKYDSKKSSLVEMLKLNKSTYAMLKENPDVYTLGFLQSHSDISASEFEAFRGLLSCYDSIHKLAKELKVSATKLARYISANKIGFADYEQYLSVAEFLGMDTKKSIYSMPRNFADSYAKAKEIKAERIAKFEAEKENLVRSTAERIANENRLKAFFDGLDGYMVYAPKCHKDFIDEGNGNNNCVGRVSYIDKVAKGETLVFFIRELNNPSASFVTMEYCHGTIAQLMHFGNARVTESEKVYEFANKFADGLYDCGYLVA